MTSLWTGTGSLARSPRPAGSRRAGGWSRAPAGRDGTPRPVPRPATPRRPRRWARPTVAGGSPAPTPGPAPPAPAPAGSRRALRGQGGEQRRLEQVDRATDGPERRGPEQHGVA